MRALVRRRPLASYLVLAYALSWAWWLPLLLRGEVTRPGQGWPTHIPGLLGPALAAVVVTGLADGRTGLAELWSRITRWRVGWVCWLLVAATAALALVGLVLPVVMGKPVPDLDDFARYSGIGEIGLPAVLLVAFLVNGLGEEIGWRGFAVERLLDRHGLTRTAFLVALMWAPWHLPTFWVIDSFRNRGLGNIGWLVGIAAGSVFLTYLYREGRRSVLLVGAWHAAFNLTSATEATSDVIAILTSAVVVFAAVWILRREQEARRGLGPTSPPSLRSARP